MTASVVSFYLDHQFLLNGLILAYGAVLAAAHFNLRRITSYLLKQYETGNLEEALEALAREKDDTIIGRVRQEFRFPLIASPHFFGLHRIRRRSLIWVIGKKNRISPRRLEEMLLLEKRGPEIKEL